MADRSRWMPWSHKAIVSLGQRWPTSSRSIIITSGMVGGLAAADTYGRELAGGPVGTAVGGAVGAIVGGAVGVWITLGADVFAVCGRVQIALGSLAGMIIGESVGRAVGHGGLVGTVVGGTIGAAIGGTVGLCLLSERFIRMYIAKRKKLLGVMTGMYVSILIGNAADVGPVGKTITLVVSSVIGGTVLVWISRGPGVIVMTSYGAFVGAWIGRLVAGPAGKVVGGAVGAALGGIVGHWVMTATTLRSEATRLAIMSGAIVGGATGGLIERAAGAGPVGTSVVGAIGAVVGGTIGAWIMSAANQWLVLRLVATAYGVFGGATMGRFVGSVAGPAGEAIGAATGAAAGVFVGAWLPLKDLQATLTPDVYMEDGSSGDWFIPLRSLPPGDVPVQPLTVLEEFTASDRPVKASNENWSMHTVRPKGVEFLSNATGRVTGSPHAHVISWEKSGFRMYIPGGVLDESEEREIALSTSHSGCFELPAGTVPVSFVYYVAPSGPFRKPVTLEIEHCCSHGMDKLKFAFAESSSKNPPYKFVCQDGGKFSGRSSYGQLQVSHFSMFTILSTVESDCRDDRAHYFHQPSIPKSADRDSYEDRDHVAHLPTTLHPAESDKSEDRAHVTDQRTAPIPVKSSDCHEERANDTPDGREERANVSHPPTTPSSAKSDGHEEHANVSHLPTTPSSAKSDGHVSHRPTTPSSAESDGREYRAYVFHQHRSKYACRVVLVVTERLAECLQVVQREYGYWSETMKQKALEFETASQELSIDMSEDGDAIGTDGTWKIFPVSMPPKIKRSEIHSITHEDRGYTPANCEMIIETKEDSPQSLIRYLLVLSGVERPIKVRISIDPEELLYRERAATHSWNGISIGLTQNIPPDRVLTTEELPELVNILSEAAYNWYLIGLQLHLKQGHLKAVGRERHSDMERFSEMISSWLNTAEPYPTVRSLARALESSAVGEARLAQEVRKAFK